MSAAFYMDHHVHSAITSGLRSRGVDVLTAYEDSVATWGDEQLLARASELKRALFTHDDDPLVAAHAWLRDGREFGGLVFAHHLVITIGQAIRDLELIAQILSGDDLRDQIVFLPFA